jgi:hypothetical protein
MKTNVGTTDKAIRIFIALIMSVLYITGTVQGALGYLALAIGGIMILTAAVGTCPLYMLFGISTCKTK